jgi:hypothetical protein
LTSTMRKARLSLIAVCYSIEVDILRHQTRTNVFPDRLAFMLNNWISRRFFSGGLISKLGINQSDPVLDLGCGQGFYRVPIIDISCYALVRVSVYVSRIRLGVETLGRLKLRTSRKRSKALDSTCFA